LKWLTPRKEFSYLDKYITDLLQETDKTSCKSASTPIDPNVKLGNEEDVVVDKEMY